MLTVVFDETLLVEIANVAPACPAATVTLAGTVATPVLLLERVTTAPPDGAGPLNVTVPCDVLPPFTRVGFRVSEDRLTALAGLTVSVVCTETLPVVAVITTGVDAGTEKVGTLKVALLEPAGTGVRA